MKYRKLTGYKYQLIDTVRTHTGIFPPRETADGWVRLEQSGWLLVRRGYAWDGPSGPTIDTRNFMRASLVHDALYQLMRTGEISTNNRKTADMLLRSMCIADGMSLFRAGYIYAAVRLFGGKSARPCPPKNKILEV